MEYTILYYYVTDCSRSTSFHSVFQLLHSGYCPYFYVCAKSTTILFLSAQVVKPCGVALITPTTSGFREHMRREGISFNMVSTMKPSSPSREEGEVVDEWLKSIITSANMEKGGANLESSVAVKGSEFKSLVNFILNNKTLIVRDGRFTGIPPTLLAPKPFLGATMTALKVDYIYCNQATGLSLLSCRSGGAR